MQIVHLWDLPEDKVYVKIKDDIRYDFFKFVKINFGGAKKLSKLFSFRIDNSYIYNWKHGVRFLPLKTLNRFLSLMNIKDKTFYMDLISSNISELKTPSKGGSVYDPKFPIKLSISLARICGNLVGDGGISSDGEDRYRAYYTNKSRDLASNFKENVLSNFSKIKIQESVDKRYDTIKIKLPRIIGIILSAFFGFQNNELKHVPTSIKNSPKNIKAAFLGALFDDEGSIDINGRKISLGLTVKDILIDVKRMLNDFGVEASKIAEITKSGNRKTFYNITITGWWNFEKLKFMKLKHPLKSNQLKILITPNRYKLAAVTRNAIIKAIKSKSGVSVKDLSKELNRPVENLKYYLRKFEKDKIIKSLTAERNLKIYYAGN